MKISKQGWAAQEQRENFEKPVIDEETGQHIRKDSSATAKEAFQALKEVWGGPACALSSCVKARFRVHPHMWVHACKLSRGCAC